MVISIVCNKVNHIDVDKIDYILRDSYHIGLPFWTISRLISMVKVCLSKIKKFAWNKKITIRTCHFPSRYRPHKQVYTHPTVKSFEYLLMQLFKN